MKPSHSIAILWLLIAVWSLALSTATARRQLMQVAAELKPTSRNGVAEASPTYNVQAKGSSQDFKRLKTKSKKVNIAAIATETKNHLQKGTMEGPKYIMLQVEAGEMGSSGTLHHERFLVDHVDYPSASTHPPTEPLH